MVTTLHVRAALLLFAAMGWPAGARAYGGGPRPVGQAERSSPQGILSLLRTPSQATARIVSVRVRGAIRPARVRRHLQALLPRIRGCAPARMRGVVAARLIVTAAGRAKVVGRPGTFGSRRGTACVHSILREPWPRRSGSSTIRLRVLVQGARSVAIFGGIVGGQAHGIRRPPRAAVSISRAGGMGRYLSHRAVRAVVRKHLSQIKACYERALVFRADLAGRVVVAISISSSGRVSHVRLRSSTIDRAGGVGACVIGRIKTWRFPPPRGRSKAVVIYPFVFKKN